MTDEEKACKAICDSIPCKTMCTKCKCYIAGFKAGRETEREYVKNNAFASMKEQGLFPFGEWHKVADGDLPDNCRYVWTNVGAGYHDSSDHCWRDDFGRLQGVIAWCEPKFEE